MNFLIQTIGGDVKHDFSFTLIESCDYHAWLGNDISFYLSDTRIGGYIPIGSVEFVTDYLYRYYEKFPKPRNVPESLFKYAGRNIFNGTKKDIKKGDFVKSNDMIKSQTNFISDGKFIYPKGNYQISEVIEIESEWRAFIFKGRLVGLQNYGGDFRMFPDVSRIEKMIKDFKGPIAYTLDVSLPGTKVVEVHDFFSCGLYGFNDKCLPFMFSQWFYEFTRNE